MDIMAIGDPDYAPNDPLNYAQKTQRKLPGKASFLPAANNFSLPQNTAFSRNAPVNTPSQNLNQIPIGGFGLGALQNAGYNRSPQVDMSSFLNQGSTNQQPTLTGYHWYSGTGGVSGGNNAYARYNWSDNSVTREPAGSQYQFPRLGLTRQDQPSLGTPSPIQYTLPGVNTDVRALSDPSVNALANAQRSTNQYGQNVINPAGGGQIISGAGPSFGSLYGSTQSTNAQGQQVLNTPSGGQAIGRPSLRKPMDKLTPGQTWLGGGNWY